MLTQPACSVLADATQALPFKVSGCDGFFEGVHVVALKASRYTYACGLQPFWGSSCSTSWPLWFDTLVGSLECLA